MKLNRFVTILLALLLAMPAGLLGVEPAAAQGSAAGADKIAQEVQLVLQTAGANDLISVIVQLKEQEDVSRIKDPERRKRLQKIVNALRKRANLTQLRLRSLLRQEMRRGAVTHFEAFWIINALEVTATPAVIQELAGLNEVDQIIPNATIQQPLLPASVGPVEANIALVNAPALWDLGWQGQGMVIANMDTGVDINHPELSATWRGGANSWFDPSGQHPTTPTDVSGHGTWTMGVMVGSAAGGGAIGMAPAAQWIAVKIFNDQGSATFAGIHAGYQWLLDPDGDPNTDDAPNVVNNSWTFSYPGCNLEFAGDLQALRAAGILPIFAAGNSGPYANTSLSPANNPGAFAVGGVNNSDGLYTYSSRGPTSCDGATSPFPQMVAPAINIRSTDLFSLYTNSTGTSLAAPHVTGALALLLSAFPDLTVAQQETALINGAIDLGPAGPDNDFGYGRLDVLRAYQSLIPSSANQPPVVSIAPVDPVTLPAGANLVGSATDDGLPTGNLNYTWSVVDSPAGSTVSFVDATAAQTSASFDLAGSYTLRLTVSDGDLAGNADVVVTVNPAPPVNQPPVVTIAPVDPVTLPAGANLVGSATDDGLPTGNLNYTWSVVDSPAGSTVSFVDATAAQTSASFDLAGSYTLRLTVSDGDLAGAADVVVTVNPAPPVNQPPVVSIDPVSTVTFPNGANLVGSVSDDGLPDPPNQLATIWSVVNSPVGSSVNFSAANTAQTSATFSTDGSYTLRLTANDGALTTSAECVVIVNPAPINQPPVVSIAPVNPVTLPAGANLVGSANDDSTPLANLGYTWSVVDSPAGSNVSFGSATAAQTSVSFDVAGSYTLRLTVNDGSLDGSADVVITVNPAPPVNQPPVVSIAPVAPVTLPAGANLVGSATDDGLPTGNLNSTWSVVTSPAGSHVSFGNANVAQTSASFDVAGSYTLRLTVSDTALSASADVVVTVNPAPPVNQPPVVSIAPVDPVTLPAGATLVGSATDDGLPTGNLNYTWSVVTSPAGSHVSFGNANVAQTSASFDVAGSYTLRLTVSDGDLTGNAEIVMTVNPALPPPTSASDIVYVSSSSGGKVSGIAFADEDILAYDPNSDHWSLIFDGSGVGLGGVDVNAFAMLGDGHILMSVDNPVTLSGLGKIDDSDIIEFAPTTLGSTTAGTFSVYLRGADVALTTNAEDIDAIDFAPDGRLLISTLGAVKVKGVTGADEDILALDRASGVWSIYFDGSDVNLTASSEDIWGLSVSDSGMLYLSTQGAFSVPGVNGKGADIFTCTPSSLGSTTACTFAMYWQGAAHGFGAEIVDGIHIGGALPVSAASAFTTATGAEIPDATTTTTSDLATELDDDPMNGDTDDGDAPATEEEYAPSIYLPLVSG